MEKAALCVIQVTENYPEKPLLFKCALEQETKQKMDGKSKTYKIPTFQNLFDGEGWI